MKNNFRNVGHGFRDTPDSYALEAVRKARKQYGCDGPIRQVRFWPGGDEVSPGTGDSIFCAGSDDCSEVIVPGQLYVVLTISDLEVYGSYRVTHRICIPCALKENIIEKIENSLH